MDLTIVVKLYGTLDKWVPGYNHETGCVVQLVQPSTVADLIRSLGIPSETVGIVSVNGQVARKETVLPDQALVKVFHPIFGG